MPTTTIPTELLLALVKVLDVVPPVLEDWIRMTGFGAIHNRDKAALACVTRAKNLHHAWLAESGIRVE